MHKQTIRLTNLLAIFFFAACSSLEKPLPPPTEGIIFVHNEHGLIFAKFEGMPPDVARDKAEWLITNFNTLCFAFKNEPIINLRNQRLTGIGCAVQ